MEAGLVVPRADGTDRRLAALEAENMRLRALLMQATGTWATVLTRSRSRAEIFAGKTLTAIAYSLVAIALLGASSIAAGVLVIGDTPLVDLSGMLIQPAQAFSRVALAWASILPPAPWA